MLSRAGPRLFLNFRHSAESTICFGPPTNKQRRKIMETLNTRYARVMESFALSSQRSADAPGKGVVFKSRYTPGLDTAQDVHLSPGTRCTYLTRSGKPVEVTLISDYRRHAQFGGSYGWEARFEDDGGISFADERRIVDWPGRVGAP